MKIYTIPLQALAIAIAAGLATSPAFSMDSQFPDCVSDASDADGDGYGWENNSSCLVTAGNDGSNNGGGVFCENGDETDPDDDGWGWENNASCMVADDGPDDDDDDDDDEEEDEGEFGEARLYFELNDTDGDLGFHGLIDGDDWIHLEIDDPLGAELFDLKLDGQLKIQRLTELFFESTEPNFDDLAPSTFFSRFPEGQYEIEATLGGGGELSGQATVTHLIPAPPANITVNGLPVSIGCEDNIPNVSEPVRIAWDPVSQSHPTLGRTGESVEIVRYELVVEVDEVDNAKFVLLMQPDITSVAVPALPHVSANVFKIEVIAREENDNQTATEACFEVN